MTTSFKFTLGRGSAVTGKWKGKHYRIERMLGEGANGKVYLVQRDKEWYALKAGADAVDLQSEINVLQSLDLQRRMKRPDTEPFLVDVDDLITPDGQEFPFYVMRYVRGVTLAGYLAREGAEWFPLVGYNLLRKLSELHEAGWSFGDLKVENILVAEYGRVELVDYGGVTGFGKGVRQFTEIYDRGYWNAGKRMADSGYDLFSFAVLCIQLHDSKRLLQLSHQLLPQNRSPEELLRLAQLQPALRPFMGWLSDAMAGRFANAREAAASWQRLVSRSGTMKSSPPVPGWMKGLFMLSAGVAGAAIIWLLWLEW
ncbi:protein kinase domain-containing protein [Paenibacillus sp. MMS18-CY102]|uniref:protein kinase domain-containing protein n=1 Tax=Paenibacillus sp. MMS18-CY102 TaxID=2682849 RepID=UPI001365BB76|nr:serine/threonine protein kinase [Paenibacillus sp. MMS18-CY102]